MKIMVIFCRNDRCSSNSREKNHLLCSRIIIYNTPAGRRAIFSKKKYIYNHNNNKAWRGKKSKKTKLWASSKMSSIFHSAWTFKPTIEQYNQVAHCAHTHSLSSLIVLGRYLKVRAGCFRSLALRQEAISAGRDWPPQKPGLYLQRASRQRAISMRKHPHKSTMEYTSRQ